VVQAGADFIAVSSAVWSHPQGPGAAVAAFLIAIKAASGA
jgi:thiamine-phosphate pyrophosphorylase